LVTAALDPNRPNLGRHVEWSVRELKRLGVSIQYNKEATSHAGEYPGFDEVVLATSWELNERAGDAAVIRHRWSEDVRAVDSADLVVFVGYNESYDPLAGLRRDGNSVPFHVVGDAKAPRLLRDAISEGALLAASL
jgi:hypothetical protein